MNFGRFAPGGMPNFKRMLRFKPRLKLHDPEKESSNLTAQVDAILEKISREGEGSLSRSERRTLEEASRKYQQKRR
jgi:hypothetical protein